MEDKRKEEEKNKIIKLKDALLKDLEKDIAFNNKLKKNIKADGKRAAAEFSVCIRNEKYLVDILYRLNEIEQEYTDNKIEFVIGDSVKKYFN